MAAGSRPGRRQGWQWQRQGADRYELHCGQRVLRQYSRHTLLHLRTLPPQALRIRLRAQKKPRFEERSTKPKSFDPQVLAVRVTTLMKQTSQILLERAHAARGIQVRRDRAARAQRVCIQAPLAGRRRCFLSPLYVHDDGVCECCHASLATIATRRVCFPATSWREVEGSTINSTVPSWCRCHCWHRWQYWLTSGAKL